MPTEIAHLTIDPARAAEFADAVARAAPLFRSAQGCSAMRLERVVEEEASFRLVVEWDRVEDHMVVFRQSSAFAHWRELVSPFFVEPPRVEHWIDRRTFF